MVNEDQLHFQNIIQYVSAVFSLSINTFLIVLIATKSPKQLGAYKYLMMCISIHEIGYSIIDVLVSPLLHSYGSTFMIISITRNRVLSPSLLLILITVYCGFFSFSLAMFALHFIYRYLVVSGNKRLLDTFSSWKFFLWLGGPIFYGVSWSLMVYFFLKPTDETIRYVGNNVLTVLDLKTDDYVYVAAFLYEKLPNGGYVFHMTPSIGVITMIFHIGFSIGTVSYFGIKCYFRIHSLVVQSKSSTNAQRLQSQLFYALVTQSLIPIILMHGPAGFTFVFIFFDWKIGSLTEIASITISLYPAIDPLPTIFIIKHYRRGALGWLKCASCQKKKSPRTLLNVSSNQNLPSFPRSRASL